MSRQLSLIRFSLVVLAAGALFLLLANYAYSFTGRQKAPAMQASVTYLYLLRKTPFFTRLTTAQLRDVIAHAQEWEVQPGTAIADSAHDDGAIWILLDGGWQVEADGKVYPALHDEAGKWYGGPATQGAAVASRLVVSQHSYVMRISGAEFARLRQQGADVDTHLRLGEAYYGRILRPAG